MLFSNLRVILFSDLIFRLQPLWGRGFVRAGSHAVVLSALALMLQARGFLAVCKCMLVLSNETPTFVVILIFNNA